VGCISFYQKENIYIKIFDERKMSQYKKLYIKFSQSAIDKIGNHGMCACPKGYNTNGKEAKYFGLQSSH
jgi:hypothetical protein